MNPECFNLTLEQSFTYQQMCLEVEQYDKEQLKELVLKSAKLMMTKDNVIKDLMKQAWSSSFVP